jgi:hypothetical protein
MSNSPPAASDAFLEMKRLVEDGTLAIRIAWTPWRNDGDNMTRVFEGVTWRFQRKVFVPIMIAIAIAVPAVGPGITYVAREMPDSWINHLLSWLLPPRLSIEFYVRGAEMLAIAIAGVIAYAYLLGRARVKSMLADPDLWEAAWKRGLVRLHARQSGLLECVSPQGDWAGFVSRLSADSR